MFLNQTKADDDALVELARRCPLDPRTLGNWWEAHGWHVQRLLSQGRLRWDNKKRLIPVEPVA